MEKYIISNHEAGLGIARLLSIQNQLLSYTYKSKQKQSSMNFPSYDQENKWSSIMKTTVNPKTWNALRIRLHFPTKHSTLHNNYSETRNLIGQQPCRIIIKQLPNGFPVQDSMIHALGMLLDFRKA